MTEFLLEVFSEEIPARMQAKAAEDLKTLLVTGLEKQGITPENPRAFVTPRRLVVVMDGLPLSQPDVKEERKGPKVDAPQPAIDGFLRSTGLTLDQCEQRDTSKGKVWFAVIEKPGRETVEVLKDVVEQALADLPWPKSMRWGTNPTRWVRPLHRIVALLNGRTVDVDHAGVKAGAETVGHRFLAPEPFTVGDFDGYRERLRAAYVMLDPAERSRIILTEAQRLCEAEGLTLKDDEGLLREVTGLVEWPVVLMGRIDDQFMDVPAEVLTTSMRSHQKYFSVLNADGSLAPRFVVVANMVAEDGGQAIVAGNERVLRARLSDAKFFWDQDRKAKLETRVEKLKDRVFHAQLGTDWDKVSRIRRLAGEIAALWVPANQLEMVDRAAHLAKADLSTGMVGEFPELQGIMGRYYALGDGEAGAVADAIAEHYSPLGPNDRCPTEPVSVAVALADKIDTLAGFFGIEEKPTGSKDPFALRRAALGVIRLILENRLRLPLRTIFRHAVEPFVEARHVAGAREEAVPAELLDFFADRLKVHLREAGTRHDLVTAVFSLGGEDDLVRLLARVDALTAFLGTDDGANLLVAHRRAANILRIEEKKDGVAYRGAVDGAALVLPQEQALAAALDAAEPAARQALAEEDFGGAMAALARLRAPVDAFFDDVTVNADDSGLRKNRLHLLGRIVAVMGEVADFSKIEG